jgi:hypothetical protein
LGYVLRFQFRAGRRHGVRFLGGQVLGDQHFTACANVVWERDTVHAT